MLDNYKVITLTHHNLDINKIGKYAIHSNDTLSHIELLRKAKQLYQIAEIIYLNTCNRITLILYLNHDLNLDFISGLFQFFNPKLSPNDISELEEHVEIYEGLEAVRHIFEVSSSIDSLIVGESEIFRQIRQACHEGETNGLAAENLRLLEMYMTKASKAVHTHTRIGEKPLSIAAIATEMMLVEMDQNSDCNILIIGAGETGELLAKLLLKKDIKNITFCNRTFSKAQYLAQKLNCNAIEWDIIFNKKHSFDVVFTATNAQQLLIHENNIHLFTTRDSLLCIDLSVPANIDSTITSNDKVRLLQIDDLRSMASKNLEFRKQEISLAKEIVIKHSLEFRQSFINRHIKLALEDLPAEIAKVKNKALENVFKNQIHELDTNAQSLIQEIMDYMEKKCVSIPMRLVKIKE